MEACACGAVPVVTSIPTFRLLTGNGSVGALWSLDDADGCACARGRRPARLDRGAGASRGSLCARAELGRRRPPCDGDL
jgi:hypothetical protein